MAHHPITADAVSRRRFVAEYLIDYNVSRAASQAGLSPPAARRLIEDDAHVREAIRQSEQAGLAVAGVTRQDVLRHTAAMLYFDPRKILDEEGGFLAPSVWPDEIALTIAGFEVNERTVVSKDGDVTRTITHKVKLPDRNAAAERLSKHLGLYAEDHAQHADAVGAMLAAIHDRGSRLPLSGQVIEDAPLKLRDFRPDEAHDYL